MISDKNLPDFLIQGIPLHPPSTYNQIVINSLDVTAVKPCCPFAKLAVLIALLALLVSPVFAGHGLNSPAFIPSCVSQTMPACCQAMASTEPSCYHATTAVDSTDSSACQNTDCHACAAPFVILTGPILLISPPASPQFTEPVSQRYFYHDLVDRPPIDA